MIGTKALRAEAKRQAALTESEVRQELIFRSLVADAESREATEELIEMDWRFLKDLCPDRAT